MEPSSFIQTYFLETGLGLATIGALVAVMFGCLGSARGIRIAASQGTGVLSEKPELFGRLLVLMALPGTQGFYGFICAIMIALRCGIISAAPKVTPVIGLGVLAIGFCVGMVQWRSAILQGETSAASINLTGKRPEEGGRSILMPALVETYSVVALLSAILMVIWLTSI